MIKGEYWRPDIETLPWNKQKERQEKMLFGYLRYTYENSPYYQKKFKEIALKPEDINSIEEYFKKVPFISKVDIIENQRGKPPFGDFLAAPEEEIVRIFVSPGPISYPWTKEDLESFVDLCANCFYANGLRHDDIVDIAFAYYWVPAGTIMDEGCRKIGAAVIPAGTGNTDMHIEVMKKAKVTAFIGTPSFLKQISERAKERGLAPKDFNLRIGIFTAEAVPEELKKELKETFGLEPRELYGTADVGLIAKECPMNEGMHIYEDILLEIIDPKTGEHVAKGEKGEVVATFLGRKTMPLLRYRTGDITQGLNEAPCKCGRTSSKLRRIIGRVGDIIKVRGMFVVPNQVEEVVRRHAELGNFQIIVERPKTLDEVRIKVESEDKSEKVMEKLKEQIKEAIKLKVGIEFVDMGEIPQDAKRLEDKRRL